MDTTPSRPAAVFGAGLLLGLLGDALLRAPGEPALNLFVWAAAVAAAVVVLRRLPGGTLSTEAMVLLGVGVLFAATLALRDSPALKLVALAATAWAFALPARRAGAAWVRRSGVLGYGVTVAATSLRVGLGVLPVLGDVDWNALREGAAGDSRWRRAASVARGLAIALPLLLVFGGLFIAADPVFGRIIADVARLDLERLASHVALAVFFGWVAIGYLHGFLTGNRLPGLQSAVPRRPALGITEVGVALGLLALLFAAFVAVQFRYLFGGAALVEVTPGLSYAEYARRGFFELVAVSALMLPVLLAAEATLRRERPRDERVFRALAATLILLLLAVMTSAFQRMRLYLDAYGLTEARFYATSMLIWLAIVLVWLAATVLRGRRRAFAFGTLVSAFVAAATLVAINPDAIVARTNLARAISESGAGAREGGGAGGGGSTALDAAYLPSLSGDAVPTLLAGLDALPADARCRIAERLLERWIPDEPPDWRNWNLSAARARAAVRAEAAELRAAARECE